MNEKRIALRRPDWLMAGMQPYAKVAREIIYNRVLAGPYKGVIWCGRGIGDLDHKRGNALDFIYTESTGIRRGDTRIGDWLCNVILGLHNYGSITVAKIIHNRRQWRPNTGWYPYAGHDPHMNHVHVVISSVNKKGVNEIMALTKSEIAQIVDQVWAAKMEPYTMAGMVGTLPEVKFQTDKIGRIEDRLILLERKVDAIMDVVAGRETVSDQ